MTHGPVSIHMVLAAVSIVFGPSIRELRAVGRTQRVAHARHAVCLIASEITSFGMPTIGRHLSDRDASTAHYSRDKARELCAADPEYAAKVETAREAALQLARSSVASRLADIDARAVADRICRDLGREPSRVSSDDVIAIAVRLLALDDVARATAELLGSLATIDNMPAAINRGHEDNVRLQRAGGGARALTATLSSALTALGYSPKEEEDHDSHTANA